MRTLLLWVTPALPALLRAGNLLRVYIQGPGPFQVEQVYLGIKRNIINIETILLGCQE